MKLRLAVMEEEEEEKIAILLSSPSFEGPKFGIPLNNGEKMTRP